MNVVEKVISKITYFLHCNFILIIFSLLINLREGHSLICGQINFDTMWSGLSKLNLIVSNENVSTV